MDIKKLQVVSRAASVTIFACFMGAALVKLAMFLERCK